MKFAAWRKVLSIFLLAVFLCAVPSLLTACSRSPASGSTELLDSTQLYFIELGRLVPGFEQPMLDSFREAAEKPPLPLRFSAVLLTFSSPFGPLFKAVSHNCACGLSL